mmetsp:Transcript_3538/g.12731  ORF Transcript_3538/g.12731 Transcript_3538/m.12731 type:complete len:625 (+) Transcript_3538:87-1961(+)
MRPKRRRYNEEDNAKRALYHCNYCQKDISQMVRVKCAVCADFDLCLECFSIGVEIGGHKNDHGYRVVDNLSFPLFVEDWGADEELLLLEAVEMYGLHNWAEVSEHVGTKSKQDCNTHYKEVYLRSKTAPLPDMSNIIGKEGTRSTLTPSKQTGAKTPAATPSSVNTNARSSDPAGVNEKPGHEHLDMNLKKKGISDHHESVAKEQGAKQDGEEQMHSKGTSIKGATPKDLNDNVVQEKPTADANGTVGQKTTSSRGLGSPEVNTRITGNSSDITGYNTKRDEFDPPYGADAELPLAELEFLDTDTPQEHKTKLRMLELYQKRLIEREERKRFILERDLLNVKRQIAADRRKPRDERLLHQRMRVFSRFHSSHEHEELLKGLLTEMRLRQRIAELKEYRRCGIHTLNEADVYEAEKRRREGEFSVRRARENSTTLSAPHSARGGNQSKAKVPKVEEETDIFKVGGAALNMAVSAFSDKPLAVHCTQTQQDSTQQIHPLLHINNPKASGGPGSSLATSLDGKFNDSSSPWSTIGLSSSRSIRRANTTPLALAGFPGVEFLHPSEAELCAVLRLLPSQYLACKDAMQREYKKQQQDLSKDEIKAMSHMDPHKAVRVYEYLKSCGVFS